MCHNVLWKAIDPMLHKIKAFNYLKYLAQVSFTVIPNISNVE